MTVMTDERTHFENEDWTVLDSGLEHRRTGYFIARDEIANRRSDGLWSWPLHMAEKSWCTMPAFVEAFTCAAAVFAVPADADLARSFRAARREVAAFPALARANAVSRAARRDAFTDRPETLRDKGTFPISGKPAGAGATAPVSQGFRHPAPVHLPGHAQGATARSRRARRHPGRAPQGRASQRIRQAGTRILQLFFAAWAIR
jgi:hypothetical protein